jgi:hypothetical protein
MADYDKDIPTDAMLFNPNSNAQAAPAKPTPFDFQKRQLAIDQRKARIAQLMKDQKLTPDMPEGSMVSGHYVNPHWSQYLAAAAQPLLGQLATNREQEALGKEQSEFSEADRKAAIEHAMNAPGVATSGEDREGNPIVPPATPAGKIQWAEQGMNIPSRRDLLKRLIEDQTLQEPIRQEARGEKRLDREDRQTEARANLASNQQLAREKLEQQGREAAQRQADAQAMRVLIQQGQQAAAEGRREAIRLAAEGKSAAETAAHSKERQGITEQARDAQERMMLLTEAQAAGKTATGSGVGSAIDKTASIFGFSTEGAKGAAKLKALQAQLLTLTPKLGGSTSDADVRNYREAVGQIGDDTLPMETRQAAMDTVQTINKRDYDNALARGQEFNSRGQVRPPTVPIKPGPSSPKVNAGGPVDYTDWINRKR